MPTGHWRPSIPERLLQEGGQAPRRLEVSPRLKSACKTISHIDFILGRGSGRANPGPARGRGGVASGASSRVCPSSDILLAWRGEPHAGGLKWWCAEE